MALASSPLITAVDFPSINLSDNTFPRSSQLNKMGIKADQGETWLSVKGGRPGGALIETFNDHRIAMAFSVAGLRVQGMEIENPGCVAKSFPSFWEVFENI